MHILQSMLKYDHNGIVLVCDGEVKFAMLFAQNVYHTCICGSSQLLSEESLELTTNTLKIKQEGVVAE